MISQRSVRPFHRVAGVLLAAGAACAPVTAQNLLDNPGFESGVVAGPFVIVSAGSSFIDGWGVSGTHGQGVDVVSVNYTSNWAHTGRQAIDMAGTPGPGTIYQDVDTEPGELFALVFAISSNNLPRNDALEVLFGGQSYGIFDSPAEGTWHTIEITGLEASPVSSTRLEFVGLVSGYQGALIDSVALTAMASVPAPDAAAALVVGGVMATRRRRTG